MSVGAQAEIQVCASATVCVNVCAHNTVPGQARRDAFVLTCCQPQKGMIKWPSLRPAEALAELWGIIEDEIEKGELPPWS